MAMHILNIIKSALKGYIGAYIVLAVSGFCFLVFGYHFSINWVTAIGGTFFGACLGSLFGRFANQDIIKNFALLSQPKLTSFEEDIKPFKEKWHIYYVIKKENNEYVWRHIPCDFSKSSVPGYLVTKEKSKTVEGKEYSFSVEAGVRGNRLISIHTVDGKDKLIRIFPSTKDEAMKGFRFGFVCLTALNNSQLIAPTILAISSEKFGEDYVIDNPLKMKELDDCWCQGMENMHYKMYPILSHLLDEKFRSSKKKL